MRQELSETAAMALDLANEIAGEGGAAFVLPEHLLLAMLRLPDGEAARLLERLAVDVQTLGRELVLGVEGVPRPRKNIELDPSLRRLIALGTVMARERRAAEIDSGHLLLAMTRSERYPVAQRLARAGATHERLQRAADGLDREGQSAQIGLGLVAAVERRASLDLLALLALADFPLASLAPEHRPTAAALRDELQDALLSAPPPRLPPHAIGETIARAVTLAAERRETFHSAHLVAAVAATPGTRLAEIAVRRGVSVLTVLRFGG
jgi:hypothetical protein